MDERQRIARYEREMDALYRQIWELHERLGEEPPCPTCERRAQLERFRQGSGLNWDKIEGDRSSMLSNGRGSRGSAR